MSIIYDQSRRRVGQVKRHPAIDAGGSSRPTALAGKGLARERIHPKASGSIAIRSQRDCDTVTDEERPLAGRVSDAGPARAVCPVRGPASESLRRTNPRESGEELPVYGDLAERRLCRGMILARSPRAESRVRRRIDR